MMDAPTRANGRPLTVSATSLSKWDECTRAWWYRYVQGLEEPTTPALELGTAVHSAIEARLLTGAWPAGPGEAVEVARAGGASEAWLAPWSEAVRAGRLVVEAAVPDTCTLGPLRYTGRIDLHGVLSGEGSPALAGETVIDHKTSSDLGRAPSPSTLAANRQLLLYAWAAFRDRAPLVVAIAHAYYQTRGQRTGRLVTVRVPWRAVDAAVQGACATAERMAETAPALDPGDVPYSHKGCRMWGRLCAFASRCPDSPIADRGGFAAFGGPIQPTSTSNGVTMSLFDKIRNVHGAGAQGAAPLVAAITPPDAPPDVPVTPTAGVSASAPLEHALTTLRQLGRWPSEAVATRIAQMAGVDLEELRTVYRLEGGSAPDAAPAAPPSAPQPTQPTAPAVGSAAPAAPSPSPAVSEEDEDDRVWAELVPSLPDVIALADARTRFRDARGMARAPGDKRWLSILGRSQDRGLHVDHSTVEVTVRRTDAPPAATTPARPDRDEVLRLTVEACAAGHDRDEVISSLVADLGVPEAIAADAWTYASARVARERAAAERAAEDAEETTAPAEVTVDVAPERVHTPPTPDAPTVAPERTHAPSAPEQTATTSAGTLLLDAVVAAGAPHAVPLREYLAEAIAIVEQAESSTSIDLVQYGKGPALVATRVRLAPALPSALVAAVSQDPLTWAVLPELTRRGWVVVRGVR